MKQLSHSSQDTKQYYNSKSNMYSLARYIRRNIRAASAKVKMTISTAEPPWSVRFSLGCWPGITSGEADTLLWLCRWARRCRGLRDVFLAPGWAACWRDSPEGFWTPYWKIVRNLVQSNFHFLKYRWSSHFKITKIPSCKSTRWSAIIPSL